MADARHGLRRTHLQALMMDTRAFVRFSGMETTPGLTSSAAIFAYSVAAGHFWGVVSTLMAITDIPHSLVVYPFQQVLHANETLNQFK